MEFFLGRLCEEFHCLPSEAFREWLQAPVGFLEEIIESRAYARAKDLYDHARSAKDLPQSPLIDLVKEIEFALVQAEFNERTHG